MTTLERDTLILQVFEQERPTGRHHHCHVLSSRGIVIWSCQPDHFHGTYDSALECAENGLATVKAG